MVTGVEQLEFQHTAARRRLGVITSFVAASCVFQHTAARRRLVPPSGV